ncbi:MAG: FAD-dependent oxidoreductase [Pseudomonadota bacterium]
MSDDHVLVVGAGHAAGQLAVSLRQGGHAGAVTLVGEEPMAPYQRPPLSKKYLAGELDAERLLLKPESFYAEADVNLMLGRRVQTVDVAAKTVALDDGSRASWDKLVFATGSRVRTLGVPGESLPGVHYLRTAADVDAIRGEFATAKRLVIVGGGYIGLEVAAVAVAHDIDVHLVEAQSRLLSRVVSPDISDFYHRVHADAGVRIHLDCGVSGFEGSDCVSAALLNDGGRLEADLVIIGIGVVPNVELAQEAGLDCDNGILVDGHCKTSHDDVYAIGDCCNHPNPVLGRRLRLESVPNALEQAKAVAATLSGTPTEYAQVPWFWSDQYDLKLQIVGLTDGYDQTVVRGDLHSRQFACFYLKQGRLIAVDAVNSPREFLFSKPAVAAGARIPADVLSDPSQSLKDAAQTWPA